MVLKTVFLTFLATFFLVISESIGNPVTQTPPVKNVYAGKPANRPVAHANKGNVQAQSNVQFQQPQVIYIQYVPDNSNPQVQYVVVQGQPQGPIEIPQIQIPQIQFPQYQIPQLQFPEIQFPEIPQIETPQIQVPQVQVQSNVQAPQVQVPQGQSQSQIQSSNGQGKGYQIQSSSVQGPRGQVHTVIQSSNGRVPQVQSQFQLSNGQGQVSSIQSSSVQGPRGKVQSVIKTSNGQSSHIQVSQAPGQKAHVTLSKFGDSGIGGTFVQSSNDIVYPPTQAQIKNQNADKLSQF